MYRKDAKTKHRKENWKVMRGLVWSRKIYQLIQQIMY